MHDTTTHPASSVLSAADPSAAALITRISANAYTIPTDAPEGDGTFEWNSTTLVVAEIEAAGVTGLGYTYSDACVATLIKRTLAELLDGEDASDIGLLWLRMQRRVRNLGRDGIAATAISALACALWDLHAKRLNVSLAKLLGQVRDRIPVYGSGGFTTYTDQQMREQLTRWVRDDGCRWVKIKIGADP